MLPAMSAMIATPPITPPAMAPAEEWSGGGTGEAVGLAEGVGEAVDGDSDEPLELPAVTDCKDAVPVDTVTGGRVLV